MGTGHFWTPANVGSEVNWPEEIEVLSFSNAVSPRSYERICQECPITDCHNGIPEMFREHCDNEHCESHIWRLPIATDHV